MRRMGPNNAKHVIWAISEFFISINNITSIKDILKLQMYLWEATMKRTGPNNTFCVVWAISKFFLLLFVFFISTNHLSHFYRYY